MKKKNLSAKKKIHNFYFKNLKNSRIRKIYYKFKKNLNSQENSRMAIAVSGGSDSIAMSFLAKTYELETTKKFHYYIVDHKLRKESTKEAKLTKKKLKNFGINCEILTWNKKKNISNLQSLARESRYNLIFNQCLKRKINLVLTAHQKNDLYENFFIRLLRGSGLKGLVSFNKLKTKIIKEKDIYIFRPLLNISKQDLKYIASKTFNFFVKDPSNDNEKFLRVKIRKLLKQLSSEGLDYIKFKSTLENLFKSYQTIEFYVKKNVDENSKFLENKKIIVNEIFFNHPNEIVFRSFSELIHKIGKKNKFTRGKKILNLIKDINYSKNFKRTLSGCIFEKSNKSLIISKEF